MEPIRYKPAYTRQPLVKRIGGQPSLGDVALSTMSGFLLELPLLTEAGRFVTIVSQAVTKYLEENRENGRSATTP